MTVVSLAVGFLMQQRDAVREKRRVLGDVRAVARPQGGVPLRLPPAASTPHGLPPSWPLPRGALLPHPLRTASAPLRHSLLPHPAPAVLREHPPRTRAAAPRRPGAQPAGAGAGDPESSGGRTRGLSRSRADRARMAAPRFLLLEAGGLRSSPPPLPETEGPPHLPSAGIAPFWI